MSSNFFGAGNPNAWTIYENKLYITGNLGIRNNWNNDISENIADADINWAKRGFGN